MVFKKLKGKKSNSKNSEEMFLNYVCVCLV